MSERMSGKPHALAFMEAAERVARALDVARIERIVEELVALRERKGRLFLIGVGGSAANASHAAADFRKLCGIEAYAPTNNVAELTARTNDEGWTTVFAGWLRASRINANDALFVLSVGGGTRAVSANITLAVDLAKDRKARVFGIVGSPRGYTARRGDIVIVVPRYAPRWVTPLSESFQAVIWHCIVCHPALQMCETKW